MIYTQYIPNDFLRHVADFKTKMNAWYSLNELLIGSLKCVLLMEIKWFDLVE